MNHTAMTSVTTAACETSTARAKQLRATSARTREEECLRSQRARAPAEAFAAGEAHRERRVAGLELAATLVDALEARVWLLAPRAAQLVDILLEADRAPPRDVVRAGVLLRRELHEREGILNILGV
jgi:hypothetical protein